ncbi:DeoR family transcriptional regulator [Rathayibacter oskolensis]|nr:DeoR family transcriptional regulator [Rathayibacter oskolensis]WKK70321.1 DeoR family transcriptional regulator [Rathayibacter oskolensis]
MSELVTLTGASAISIRRDLTELAEQGALRRVRAAQRPSPRADRSTRSRSGAARTPPRRPCSRGRRPA